MIVKRDGNQGIVFFESVLCKSKYLRIRLSQYIPLKQGLRQIVFTHTFKTIDVTVYSTKTRIKTRCYYNNSYCCKSQYIPLKQGFFSIQNYELRIKNEGRNGSGVG